MGLKSYAIVGFIYNQACPLKCNFCCHTREVVGGVKCDPKDVTAAIIGFAAEPSVVRFAFSGGDPFLYFDEIADVMAAARAAGVRQPFHMVTSGFWARDPAKRDRWLEQLAGLGMDALDISYDHEHARFVSADIVVDLVEACLARGIRTEVFGNFWHRSERTEDLLPSLKGKAPLYSNLVMPIGAARDHFTGPRYGLSDETKYSCGKPSVYDVAIYPDGTAYPCCSGGFNKEADLACGNIHADSPSAILEAAFTNFHARLAKEIGFDKLYARIQEADPALFARLPQFSNCDSVCEICRDLRTPALQAALHDAYDELEIDYVLALTDLVPMSAAETAPDDNTLKAETRS